MYAEAMEKNIPVYAVTNKLDEASKYFAGTSMNNIPIMKCDFTAIRTAARANPTIYLLEKGTVLGKWSHRRSEKAAAMIRSVVVPTDTTPPMDTTTPERTLEEPITPKIK